MRQLYYSIKLANAGVFLGSKKNNWSINSEKFLSGYKRDLSIFNISITSFFFLRAINFVEASIYRKSRGFFFGLVESFYDVTSAVNKLARLDQVVSTKNWRGGYLTNTKFLRSYIKNSQKRFSFIVSFKFDYSNFPILREAMRVRLPLVSPVDSNSNFYNFSYPIPSNSTGSGIIQTYALAFLECVFRGIQRRTSKLPKFRQQRTRRSNTSTSSVFHKKKYWGSQKYKVN